MRRSRQGRRLRSERLDRLNQHRSGRSSQRGISVEPDLRIRATPRGNGQALRLAVV